MDGDRILRIDMSAPGGPTVTQEPLGDLAGLGGRAMTSLIVTAEVDPLCHPLGPGNKLVFAPGMLTGSSASTSGRISVGCKSPLTGGIKEANAGGQAGQHLARLGIRAMIVEGQPEGDDLWTVVINQDGEVSFKVDNSLRMQGTYATVAKLTEDYGPKATFMVIGQAGEMMLGGASIAACDRELRPTRHMGRGGVGAVMGSKKIKAFVIDAVKGPSRQPAQPERFKEASRLFNEGLKRHGVSGEGLPTFGTNILTNILNEAGGYPTRNFSSGHFEEATQISGETQAETMIARDGSATHACHRGCIIQCSGIYNDKEGNYVSKQAEYETVWSHGGHCGISDLDVIQQLDRMDDDFGLDTIETGVAIGVAMEGGLLPFGDGPGAVKVLEEVGKGTPLGRIIGSGAVVTGKAFGVRRVPVVKGQAIPAYDPRAVQGIGVTYATTPMGADHTAGYTITANILGVGGQVDPLHTEGQIELSRNLQIATAVIDSTGLCLFVAFPVLDQPETFAAMLEVVNGFFGTDLTPEDVTELGKKILSVEREFNAKAGFTAADDRLPEFFRTEPIAPHDVTFDVKDEELDAVFNW